MLERFRIRRREPEIMDQPGLDEQSHRRALAGLRRINRFSRTGSVAWTAIERLVASDPARTWRVLDVATGGGDVAIDVARRVLRFPLVAQALGRLEPAPAVDLIGVLGRLHQHRQALDERP